MAIQKGRNEVRLTTSKKIIFSFVLVTMSIVSLLIVEVVLRLIDYGDDLNLFITHPVKEYEEYKVVNPKIGKKYFDKFQHAGSLHDMFRKEKPENGFRIFVMGSSTVVGFPYEENLAFSKILYERLQDSYPNRYIEVINTAITAINSYTLLDYIGDILKEEPDAILFYEGHNEFYGAFGNGSIEKTNRSRVLTFLHLDLLSLRIYQLVRNTINKINQFVGSNKSEEFVKGTLMKLIVDNKEISYKSGEYTAGMEAFTSNMESLLSKTTEKNVPVFISEAVSNVKDLPPFCSVATDSYPLASKVFTRAKQYEENGDYKKAKEHYYLAKDLDGVRFRASEEINETIHDLADRYHATLVPMKKYFEESSPNGLIGNNLITEHVHPNIDGYFLMADAFYNEIVASKLIGGQVDPIHYKNSDYYKKNWAYTDLDSLIGVHKINSLLSYWPFQPLENLSSPHYLDIYHPNTKVDSVAFAFVQSSDPDIHGAHVTMAELYKAGGEYFKAFKEYYAAIKCNPFYVKDHLEAVSCLMHTNDFILAQKIVNQSLKLQKTFFAYYYRSEILFLMGDYAGAINDLNTALELEDTPEFREKALKKMHKVYFYSGNKNKMFETLTKVRKIDPGYHPIFPKNKTGFAFLIPAQVEKQVDRAYGLYEAGKFDAALSEFLISLEIKETPLANRCIGDILFSRNDRDAIVYYQKAYNGYKYDVNFLVNLTILYLENKLAERANELLHEIKQLDPKNKKIAILEKSVNELNK